MISAEEIEAILTEKLKAVEIKITDDGHLHLGHRPDNPAYYTIEIASPLFKGKTLIQQHKMVYDSLKDEMQEKIHALSLKTKAVWIL